jgi:tetratricopeptide (TPR) repeat protein
MSYWTRLFTIFLCSLLSPTLAAEDTLAVAAGYEVNGDYEAALAAYSILLDETSSEKGDFAIDLIEPLMGLSRGYMATGSIDLAEETLRRAQHISHRNEGVYSPKQFEAIELLTRIALNSNDPGEADKQQRFLFFLGVHNFDGLEVLPVYMRYSRWFIETGQYQMARKTLEQAIDLVLETSTEQDIRQLEPLRLLAKIRRFEGSCCGEKSLKKALEIISTNDSIAGDLRSEAYSELADAYTLRGKPDEAARFYLLAWKATNDGTDQAPRMIAMSGKLNTARRTRTKSYRMGQDRFSGFSRMEPISIDEDIAAKDKDPQQFLVPLQDSNYNIKSSDAMRSSNSQEKMIGRPFQFFLAQIQNILPNSMKHDASLASISISLDFTVTAEGTIRDVEFTKSNAPVKLNRLMEEVIKKTRFRPALVDGHPVSTQNVTVIQSFAPN